MWSKVPDNDKALVCGVLMWKEWHNALPITMCTYQLRNGVYILNANTVYTLRIKSLISDWLLNPEIEDTVPRQYRMTRRTPCSCIDVDTKLDTIYMLRVWKSNTLIWSRKQLTQDKDSLLILRFKTEDETSSHRIIGVDNSPTSIKIQFKDAGFECKLWSKNVLWNTELSFYSIICSLSTTVIPTSEMEAVSPVYNIISFNCVLKFSAGLLSKFSTGRPQETLVLLPRNPTTTYLKLLVAPKLVETYSHVEMSVTTNAEEIHTKKNMWIVRAKSSVQMRDG